MHRIQQNTHIQIHPRYTLVLFSRIPFSARPPDSLNTFNHPFPASSLSASNRFLYSSLASTLSIGGLLCSVCGSGDILASSRDTILCLAGFFFRALRPMVWASRTGEGDTLRGLP